MKPLLTIEHLNVNFEEKQVLKDINLTINRGEIFALMGPSGSGKTTLLRTINLLQTPTSGNITFDNHALYPKHNDLNLTSLRRRMSLVFQTPALFNDTVYNNIAYSLKIRKMNREIIEEKVKKALSIVGLEGYEKRRAKTLSGGEAQRLSFARAIVFQPELLLLDEPTTNLDPLNVAKIEELIRTINQQHNTTIILTTHNTNQVRRLAERVGIILNGELIETGSKETIFTTPQDPRTHAFLRGEMIY
jgi:tungstate transport system ATP-binding protein